MSDIPLHLCRFLPEASRPSPADRFDAWLAEQGREDGESRHVPDPSRASLRTRLAYAVPLAVIAAPGVIALWRALA